MIIQPDKIVAQAAANAIHKLWETEVDPSAVQVQITRKEFEGDYTVVVFPFVKTSRQAPEATGAAMGEWIVANVPEISAFNCVKGFLNLSLSNEYWNSVLAEMVQTPDFGQLPDT